MADKRYYDDRRKREMEDAGMIKQDYNAIGNLPQESVIKQYPKTDYGMKDEMDDTIRGIDEQINSDVSQMRKFLKPKK